MATAILPAPGTNVGPCKIACEHRDCRATKLDAAMICPRCLKPIGYETRYYTIEHGKSDAPREGLVLAHAICEEKAADAERAKA